METKEGERAVVAKPVPSRPTCSSFRSFSDLLAGAIKASPSNTSSETIVTAIRPKTVRFKPMANHVPPLLVASEPDLSVDMLSNSFEKVGKSDNKPYVVYKPHAKLVSKATVSLLANMGTFNTSQQMVQPQEPHLENTNKEKQKTGSLFVSHLQNLEDPKASPVIMGNGDRPSYDGYNWRKYGQKQVKGSEYPRSYYKCTHPSCPVKKKVERSFDGQIAEIVYKGEHNHPKPQPPKRNLLGMQGPGFACEGSSHDAANNPSWIHNQLSERNEGSEIRVENHNEIGLPQGKFPPLYDHSATRETTGASDNTCGIGTEFEEGNNSGPKSKRRRKENQSNEVGTSGDIAQDPKVMMQSSTDSEILGDGYRWRKYGQKVVKGNSYPRSYYRCTSPKCNVRKHVERASDDSRAFITTYEGKHNHEMPSRNVNNISIGPAEQDSETPKSKDKL